ncbi:hypothetical protein LSH36_9g11032 [Paralvinella palmiformis]|uniref:Fibronectin type-III domain-containing protein n=1 Tax=Paralvinella palmiformis TaxID=53620 RepID=A0AAD9KE62_9ANNE|nr:hypothetical protein LSH36_9g11032 [Paralvinella palmiformis]
MATFFTNEGTFGSRKSGSISFYRHNDIVIDGLKFQRSAKECVTVPRRQEVLVHRSAECELGCELWRNAIQASCLDACMVQVKHSINNTVSEDTCDEDVLVMLGNLTSPVLVAGSKTNETVILDWVRPPVSNVTYILQKLYLNLSEKWEQHMDIDWLTPNRILVRDLHPYVTYKFRIVVVASPQHTVISPESVPIATKEYGRQYYAFKA